jgi:hypothetical protein
MNLHALLLLALGSVPLTLTAQTKRYVDNTGGSDTNSGLDTLNAWATIQHAFDVAAPGDSVFIRGGDYTEHPVLNVQGAPGAPIWFGGYPGEGVNIIGLYGVQGPTRITMIDKSHVVLERLSLNYLYGPDATGVLIRCTPNGLVQDVKLKYLSVLGICWTTNPNLIPGPNDNAQPVIVYGQGTTASNAISGLEISHCTVQNCNPGYSGSISLDGNITDALITQCGVHNNKNIGIHMGGGYGVCSVPTLDKVRNSVITKCSATGNVSAYATIAGIYIDGTDSIIVHSNLCRGNGYGIEVGCEQNGTSQGVVVIDNLLYWNKESGLAIGGYDTQTTGQVTGALVRNNCFHRNDSLYTGSGEMYITKASDCVFRNNGFNVNDQHLLFTREDIGPQGNNSMDFDAWWVPTGDPLDVEVNWGATVISGYADYLTTTGWNANGFFDEPQLVWPVQGGFSFGIQPTSPCVDAGDPATVVLPIEGPLRWQGPAIDIGRIELANTSTGMETSMGATLALYPNPAGDRVWLPAGTGSLDITLLDATGRIVRKVRLSGGYLDLAGLSAGLHLVVAMDSDGHRFTGRLVKE